MILDIDKSMFCGKHQVKKILYIINSYIEFLKIKIG